MEEIIKKWEAKYNIKEIKLAGYRGGYPIIEFDKAYFSQIDLMSQRQVDRIVRSAEMSGGYALGVGMNFRKTAGLIVNNETIVIYGHAEVIEKIFEKLFNY